MNRPWKIWMVFGVCLLMVLAAMGWVSWMALGLDGTQQRAAQQAALEEKVRLALWRMDSALGPLMVEESARPASVYAAFYGAQRAYTKGYTQLKQGEVLVPSPLLTFASSNILLHFQIEPNGGVTSPQVPPGSQVDLGQPPEVSRERLTVYAGRLNEFRHLLAQPAVAPPEPGAMSGKGRTTAGDNGGVLVQEMAEPAAAVATSQPPPGQFAQARQSPVAQSFINSAEWNARANYNREAQQQAAAGNNVLPDEQQQQQQQQEQPVQAPLRQPGQRPGVLPTEGLFKPVWVGGQLVLARRVTLEGRWVIQGAWLNWTNLKHYLVSRVADLLPEADLQPMTQANGEAGARMLAALPVKLVTGPAAFAAPPAWTLVRISLAVAWVGMTLGAVAVGVLLYGAVSLSERRGAFVSAVTHELRTPLTTFKMYSEMLAEDMVQDAVKRRQYLNTLCSEANRLTHLVENVLAYARLERGSARRRMEQVSLRELLERVKPRLEQRAEQAGMAIAEECDEAALGTAVQVDVAAVEQILFNLVDNACKYAAPTASEKLIHLEALPCGAGGRFAMLRVRDHGQGISQEGARRLFQPFCKSASEAAQSAPGVGLGLALCRRLSRSLGGDLRWVSSVPGGACFELALPVHRAAGAAQG